MFHFHHTPEKLLILFSFPKPEDFFGGETALRSPKMLKKKEKGDATDALNKINIKKRKEN